MMEDVVGPLNGMGWRPPTSVVTNNLVDYPLIGARPRSNDYGAGFGYIPVGSPPTSSRDSTSITPGNGGQASPPIAIPSGLSSPKSSSTHNNNLGLTTITDSPPASSSTSPSSGISRILPRGEAGLAEEWSKCEREGLHIIPPKPEREAERLAELYRLDILDTKEEEPYDFVTRMCQRVFSVPIAIVSLVDAERQWFKSRVGLEAQETSRNHSFCAWAVSQTSTTDDLYSVPPRCLVVPDTFEDARFMHNPLVTGPPYIRFYAGAPLVLSNHMRMGALCIIDTEPRKLNITQCQMLSELAAVVVDMLENRVKKSKNQFIAEMALGDLDKMHAGLNSLSEGCAIWDLSTRKLIFVNRGFEVLTGYALSVIRYQKELRFLEGVETDENARKSIARAFSILSPHVRKRSKSKASSMEIRKSPHEPTEGTDTDDQNGTPVVPPLALISQLKNADSPLRGDKAKRLSTFRKFSAGDSGALKTEAVLHRRDGFPFWAQITLRRQDSRVNRTSSGFIIGVLTDITMQKQAEHTMETARAASEEAKRAKDEFLANMSHEIRTPLNGILAASGLLIENPQFQPNTEVFELLKMVQSSAQSLLELADTVLDFSKLVENKVVLRRNLVNLELILNEVMEMFSVRAKAKRLRFTLHVNEDVPLTLWTDAERLKQILGHLISNALNFTEQGYVDVQVSCQLVQRNDPSISEFPAIQSLRKLPRENIPTPQELKKDVQEIIVKDKKRASKKLEKEKAKEDEKKQKEIDKKKKKKEKKSAKASLISDADSKSSSGSEARKTNSSEKVSPRHFKVPFREHSPRHAYAKKVDEALKEFEELEKQKDDKLKKKSRRLSTSDLSGKKVTPKQKDSRSTIVDMTDEDSSSPKLPTGEVSTKKERERERKEREKLREKEKKHAAKLEKKAKKSGTMRALRPRVVAGTKQPQVAEPRKPAKKRYSRDQELNAEQPSPIMSAPLPKHRIKDESVDNLAAMDNQFQLYDITFRVTDTGIGMSSESQRKLFMRFTQADQARNRKVGGVGLGLSFSKQLAKLMEGDIELEKSTPGQGSTFLCTIRASGAVSINTALLDNGSQIARAASRARSDGKRRWSRPTVVQPTPRPSQTKREPVPAPIPINHPPSITASFSNSNQWRVLIAEDNRINKAILVRILKSLQYEVIDHVENGKEVMDRFTQGQRYDIILMDLHMPEMDGLTCTRTLRETLRPEEMPIVVAVTADVMQGIEQRCRDVGMSGYISKPLVKAKVADVLLRVTSIPVGQSAWVS